MAKQRCERRNKKEEIKVTSKHFYGLGELFRYVRTRFSKKEKLRTKGYPHTPHCRIQFTQQFISSYISIFYTLLSEVKDSLIPHPEIRSLTTGHYRSLRFSGRRKGSIV